LRGARYAPRDPATKGFATMSRVAGKRRRRWPWWCSQSRRRSLPRLPSPHGPSPAWPHGRRRPAALWPTGRPGARIKRELGIKHAPRQPTQFAGPCRSTVPSSSARIAAPRREATARAPNAAVAFRAARRATRGVPITSAARPTASAPPSRNNPLCRGTCGSPRLPARAATCA
jgi:hypothetical protein